MPGPLGDDVSPVFPGSFFIKAALGSPSRILSKSVILESGEGILSSTEGVVLVEIGLSVEKLGLLRIIILSGFLVYTKLMEHGCVKSTQILLKNQVNCDFIFLSPP